jgi:phage shock protein E
MIRRALFTSAVFALALASAPLAAAQTPATPSRVDYAGFVSLTGELQTVRAAHLVSLDRFWALAAEGDTLILDARSRDAFARGHIEGAVNLPLTDFTAQSLAKTIGDPNRRLLIYCNNNFVNNTDPVVTKQVRLALNIQTFINLHGYGYGNVYELADAVDFNSPRVRWVRGDPLQPAPPAAGSAASSG